MDRQRRAVAWAAILLAALTFLLVKPILLPLVLAAWYARLARPLRDKLPFRRGVSAVLLTVALIVCVAGPIALLYKFLGEGAMGLAEAVGKSHGIKGALEALVTAGEKPVDMGAVQQLVKQHSDGAQSAAKYAAVFGLGTLLFFFFLALGSSGLLSEGEALLAWMRAHQPLKAEHFDRLAAAFTETGRGLFCYVGLTCLTQGVLCTVTFLALGVPRAFVLGFVCALFAVLPVVGTPLVWIPVAAGLFITGATAKGIILLVVGGAVIGVVELIIGPMFSKVGKLQLSGPLVMLGMFGGALGFGPAGLFFGPLVLRLAKEALDCARDSRVVGPPDLA